MTTERKDNDYVLVLELPADVDVSRVEEKVDGRTIVIKAPRLPRRTRRAVSIDHRYFHPEATPS